MKFLPYSRTFTCRCGESVTTSSRNQKYCKPCGKEAQRISIRNYQRINKK